MKKFFAAFAFAAVIMFTAFAPRAFAEVNITINEAAFVLDKHQIVLNTTVENTIAQRVRLKKFQVNDLKIFDADRNLLWGGNVTFDNLDVPIEPNGSVQMTFTLEGATPPDYTGPIYTEDDSLVFWTAE